MLVALNEPGIGPIVAKAFPANRKPIEVREFVGPMSMNSYWDGGSKDEYRLVDLATGQLWSMPSSHPMFDYLPSGDRCGRLQISALPENAALVQGGVCLGKPAKVTVFLRSDNMVKMIAHKPELTDPERKALEVIGSIRGGVRGEYFRDAGLGEYGAANPVIASLVVKGLAKANKAGAVQLTIEGRNARR